MIKLVNLLKENNKILIPRRSPEERQKNYIITVQKKIQQYIKDGSKGDLDLSDTPITSLPDNLKVGRHLFLSNTPITSLPDNLQVKGNLFLSRTLITSLPDNLKIGGSLNLFKTAITSLPDNLEVGGNLILHGTKITSLPDNLKVEGNISLTETPMSKKYTEKQIQKMAPGIKGDIYM